jgi:hypothetical protein
MMLSATQIKESWPSLDYSLKARIVVFESLAVDVAVNARLDSIPEYRLIPSIPEIGVKLRSTGLIVIGG